MNQVDMHTMSDDELVEGLHAGKVECFEVIYNKYASKLYSAAYNILRNKEACEDVIQELFIDLWLKKAQLRILKLNAYLYTAVRNKALMVIRSGRVTLDLEVITMLIDDYATDDFVIQKEIKESLDREVSSLPAKCREIFVLSRQEQLSHKEIAAQLNISVKTVENQITTALKRLRASLVDLMVLTQIFLSLFWF